MELDAGHGTSKTPTVSYASEVAAAKALVSGGGSLDGALQGLLAHEKTARLVRGGTPSLRRRRRRRRVRARRARPARRACAARVTPHPPHARARSRRTLAGRPSW